MSGSSRKREVSEESDADPPKAMLPPDVLRSAIHIESPIMRNALSEFFGTALLLFIGDAVVMQFILSGEKLNTWIQINVGWAFAITLCVYTCAKTSGGHLNPAVSLTMVTLGKLSFPHFLIYCVVQTAGALVGAAAALGVYYDQFMQFTRGVYKIIGPNSTARCFCSFPDPHITNTTCFFDQIVGTGLLLFFVCVIIDKRNGIPDYAHPFLFGITLLVIGTCYGMNLGYPINPARDLGPRILAFFIYGDEVFSYHDYYFWIPIIAPCIGGVMAAWMYHTCIGSHIPDPVDNFPECKERGLEAATRKSRRSSKRHRFSPKSGR
ncbi:hypothetical protein KIN20_016236 [Parelaphostrongylus tenuis]|uniref:Uncharacterized protein n=1 Tax=Parelaphostrongylus tenuis TaxID=148309 RepID=A0AAD5QMU6_PARTN|nr:hypothetical protein KIN20_016236 [Parelaphostrongylus tenuis]